MPVSVGTKGAPAVNADGNDLVIGTMRIRRLPSGVHVAVSETGDWEFFDDGTLELLKCGVDALPIDTAARLISKFLIDSHSCR